MLANGIQKSHLDVPQEITLITFIEVIFQKEKEKELNR